jgi:hypothetical protein
MIKIGYHGEVIPVQIAELPQNLKKIKPKNGYVVVGLSEVTGNDHRVEVHDHVEFFEDRDGVLYCRALKPTKINCVIEERHNSCILPTGNWRFDKAQEFDPLAQELRQVAD